MKKNTILLIICACVLAVAMTITVFASETAFADNKETSTISEVYIPSESATFQDSEPEPEVVVLDTVVVERVEPTTYDEANSLLDEATKCQETAQMVLDGLIELGYEPDHPAIESFHSH